MAWQVKEKRVKKKNDQDKEPCYVTYNPVHMAL